MIDDVMRTLAICSRLGRNLLSVVACVAFLLPAASAQVANQSNPPPLGTLVDVGGYRVHLYCVGDGSPTVMIVGAAFTFDWGLVQPEVAKWTRVCTFDPSGTAWSDAFQTPTLIPSSRASDRTPEAKVTPTCADRVDEIHRLLAKAPIDGPYILVGFSVGALWERIYAARYPDNIAGMINHLGVRREAIVRRFFFPKHLSSRALKTTQTSANYRRVIRNSTCGLSLNIPFGLVQRWQLIASPL
jgi:pimeloyl-ACP methyl ester carboxylesterase